MSMEESRMLTIDDLEDIRCLIEAGMIDEAEEKFVAIARTLDVARGEDVFSTVGTLTRNLHDAVKDFASDDRMKVIANVDIPKASERLSSIIDMTDNAATRTLDAVDACEPLARSLLTSIENLLPAWDSLMHGRIDRDNFVTLCRNVDGLIHDTKDNAEKVVEQLNVILMAQDYQDLTGQMIQKVISLVREVEDKLLKFLMYFSEEEKKAVLDKHESVVGLVPQGPAPESSKQTEMVAASQDDVDDLLASLGF